MEHLKIFIDLTRLINQSVLCFYFGLVLGDLTYAFSTIKTKKFFTIIYFIFLGSVLMRSAGCIVNDIVDKDFDKKVLEQNFDL